MRCHRVLPIVAGVVLGMLLYGVALGLAQERPTLLAGHGTLSGSILPLWVGAEAKLFEKHGLQVKPIYLPRAAGRPALLSGDIQIYFSAGPPLVQMRLGGADVVVTSCVVHTLTSKIMVTPSIQKVADLRGKVLAVANPGSASDFAAHTELGLKNLAHANDILPSFVSDCIVTRGDLWRKRFDDLVGLLAATMNAYDHALTHKADTVGLARRIAKLPAADPMPAANFDEVISNRSISPTLELDITKLLWLRDFLADEGLIDADFEPGTMIDRSARERALARIKGP